MATSPISKLESMGRAAHDDGYAPIDFDTDPPLQEGSFRIEDDDGFGYKLVKPEGHGSIKIGQVLNFPASYIRGTGKAIRNLVELHTTDSSGQTWPSPESRVIPFNGHERVALITEPNPELDLDPKQVTNNVMLPGLTELDTGSAKNLHDAIAMRNPDRRTITLTTPGVSHAGRALPIKEAYKRRLEKTADENLDLLPWLTREGEVKLIGTSLGSYMAMQMEAMNLAADRINQLGVTGVNLLAPAVGARNVAEHERFRESDLTDEELIDQARNAFLRHMLVDPLRSALRHPERTAHSLSLIGAYVLSPKKLPHRAAAIAGNFKGVQEGMDWEIVKDVARGTELHVLGGAEDPLIHASADQWVAIQEYAPRTKFWVVEGLGHTMTLASHLVADYLAEMEEPDKLIASV